MASDGSTDRTDEIAASTLHRASAARLHLPRRGKNVTLNESCPPPRGDIIVFTDANGKYQKDASRRWCSPSPTASVGCVCGELIYHFRRQPVAKGYNLYWALRPEQKRLESSPRLPARRERLDLRDPQDPLPTHHDDVCNDMVLPIGSPPQVTTCLYEPQAISRRGGLEDSPEELGGARASWAAASAASGACWPDMCGGRAWLVGWELLSRKVLRYCTP